MEKIKFISRLLLTASIYHSFNLSTSVVDGIPRSTELSPFDALLSLLKTQALNVYLLCADHSVNVCLANAIDGPLLQFLNLYKFSLYHKPL